ncbi:MAG: LysM peptidoglycan-binding domain-containing protein [Actinomyces sp.]|nr:LysM peptidoglycan-binding domain-containing protein [Actinomyces sp.]MCI1641253.1 LysM peptidoglycan-binding domain-containing protein [Actinomyces sp.]MCI1662072.1 LysM peptidoglycan-binding domain-containing protein [Actinomyces sp.]MCI1691944.1 LysM peptidoglycan-binding domain-containing protein [Actinomyces sp.]MCI1786874.1 LysM peptidoglycan-binding domain-containing protein [Actinomyces sp.]MCI1828984.1 LysM peptidoglycan-binding domain-containing protein [Actinomyces sp.]
MSALTMASGGAPARAPRPRRLRAVPDAPLADVRDISTAPSAARRREAVLAEDPATQRRPAGGASVRVGAGARGTAGRRSPVLRIVTGMAAVAAATGVAVAAGVAAQPDPYAGPTFTHSVSAGESVWGLAAQLDSDRPLDEVVHDIERLNDLDGGLSAGQEVTLPVE